MSDIFVSYARSDRGRVEPIVRVLEALGWTVWWDTQLASGTEFDREIGVQLRAAKCVLVVWSRNSVDSNWVKGEARDGLARGVVVPVLLDEIEVPLDFRSLHFTDLVGWRGEVETARMAELSQAVSRLISAPPNPRGTAALHRKLRAKQRGKALRYGALGSAAVVLLLALFDFDGTMRTFQRLGMTVHALESSRPFSPAFAGVFDEKLALLQSEVSSQLPGAFEDAHTDAWSLGQLIAARRPTDATTAKTEAFLEKSFDQSCQCWPTSDGLQETIATAWVLLAESNTNRRIAPGVIDKLRSVQSPDGWWAGSYRATRDPVNASTYVTAMLVLSLDAYRRRLAAADPAKSRIDRMIERAANWLFANQPTGGQLWTDMLNNTADAPVPSRGVSALVVFTLLHVVGDNRAQAVFQNWASTLGSAADFSETESSVCGVRLDTGQVWRYAPRYVIFAWEIAALSEGYPKLSLARRIAAQQYFADAIRHWNVDEKSIRLFFLQPESLVALRYAQAAQAS